MRTPLALHQPPDRELAGKDETRPAASRNHLYLQSHTFRRGKGVRRETTKAQAKYLLGENHALVYASLPAIHGCKSQ